MLDPYERVKGGRLSFKGGDLATRKSIEKKKKKQKKNKEKLDGADVEKMAPNGSATSSTTGALADVKDDIYSIDAAKKKKYDDLFPVEAKKFGYIPKSNVESVAQALDDRVKKKADRYCK